MLGSNTGHLLQNLLGSSDARSGGLMPGQGNSVPENNETGSFLDLVNSQLESAPDSTMTGALGQIISQIQTQIAAQGGNGLPHGNRAADTLANFMQQHAASIIPLKPETQLQQALRGENILTDALTDSESGLKTSAQPKLQPHELDSILDDLLSRNRNINDALRTAQGGVPAARQELAEAGQSSATLNREFLSVLSQAKMQGNTDESAGRQTGINNRMLLASLSSDAQVTSEAPRTDGGSAYNNLVSTVSGRPVLAMNAPVTNAALWQQNFGEKIMWMINNNTQSAEIRLNPPELGPLEVRISMKRDDANISFMSTNSHIREVIETALPRLREMLSENGLNLADVDVSDKSAGSSHEGVMSFQRDADASGSDGSSRSNSENTNEAVEQEIVHIIESGRIDLFV